MPRGIPLFPEEARRRQSKSAKESAIRRYENPDEHRKSGDAQRKRFENPNERIKQSEAQKKSYKENPEIAKRKGESLKKHYKETPVSNEVRKRNSEAQIKYHANHPISEDDRTRQSETMMRYYTENPEARQRQSESVKAHHRKNPETSQRMRKSTIKYYEDHPETAQQIKETQKQNWIDLSDEEKNERTRNIGKARGESLNDSESSLLDILENLFPGKWMYNQDYQYPVGGKAPDFLRTDGQRKLIELFGNHWHTPNNAIEKTLLYNSLGYEVLIIWEYELSTSDLESRLKEFCSN